MKASAPFYFSLLKEGRLKYTSRMANDNILMKSDDKLSRFSMLARAVNEKKKECAGPLQIPYIFQNSFFLVSFLFIRQITVFLFTSLFSPPPFFTPLFLLCLYVLQGAFYSPFIILQYLLFLFGKKKNMKTKKKKKNGPFFSPQRYKRLFFPPCHPSPTVIHHTPPFFFPQKTFLWFIFTETTPSHHPSLSL